MESGELGKIDIITFTDVADSYTTTYDNYPGWEIEGVKTAQTEDNVLIIGYMIAKYPETENWFVEDEER